ncbi:hypothetical protein ACWCQQ_46510, partial [Streptomyces sp. NPDC002143]
MPLMASNSHQPLTAGLVSSRSMSSGAAETGKGDQRFIGPFQTAANAGLFAASSTNTATCTDGTRLHDGYWLVTTLLDPDQDPSDTLVRLYHERWQIESAYY